MFDLSGPPRIQGVGGSPLTLPYPDFSDPVVGVKRDETNYVELATGAKRIATTRKLRNSYTLGWSALPVATAQQLIALLQGDYVTFTPRTRVSGDQGVEEPDQCRVVSDIPFTEVLVRQRQDAITLILELESIGAASASAPLYAAYGDVFAQYTDLSVIEDDLVTNAVEQWTDLSGNGHHLTLDNGVAAVIDTDVRRGIQIGDPDTRYRSDNSLSATDGPDTNDFHVFIVGKAATSGSIRFDLGWGTGFSAFRFIGEPTTIQVIKSGQDVFISQALPTSLFLLDVLRINGTVSVYLDGVFLDSDTINGAMTGNFQIGREDSAPNAPNAFYTHMVGFKEDAEGKLPEGSLIRGLIQEYYELT